MALLSLREQSTTCLLGVGDRIVELDESHPKGWLGADPRMHLRLEARFVCPGQRAIRVSTHAMALATENWMEQAVTTLRASLESEMNQALQAAKSGSLLPNTYVA